MGDKTSPSDVIRQGATRAQAYNEGLLVYLYDEKNRQVLLEQNAGDLVNLPIARNAEQAKIVQVQEKKLAQFSHSALLVAYELRQDDSIEVDVVVGDPLSPVELKVVKGLKWHKPQKSRLLLPSGRLRIETANSCRIIADDQPQEAGATIEVPAGEYLLTLYRVDVEETGDAVRKEYWEKNKGPLEVVVLTPAHKAKLPRTTSALVPFPLHEDKLDWVGNYSISAGDGECKVNFWDYRELYKLNLDRAALSALKVEAGSVLEISAVGRKFTVLYLEKIEFGFKHLGVYQMIFGNERLTASLSSLPEVAFAVLKKEEAANAEVLGCMRIKASENIDEKHHGKWRKAKLHLLPQRLELVDRASFGRWRLEEGALHGEVLFRTPYYISMNFDAAALQALGANVGDILRLRAGDQAATLRVLENSKQFLESSKARGYQKDGPWEKLKERFTFAADEEEKERVREEMRAFLLDEIPLFGYLDSHWYDQEQKIFLAHPSAVESGFFRFNFKHGLAVEPGTNVVLEKA
jgi:hypothetical protein